MNIRQDGKQFIVCSNNKAYIVKLNPISCSCPAFKYINKPIGTFCKHIKAVVVKYEK